MTDRLVPFPNPSAYERTFMNIDSQAQGIDVRIVPNNVDLGGSYFFQRSNWQ